MVDSLYSVFGRATALQKDLIRKSCGRDFSWKAECGRFKLQK